MFRLTSFLAVPLILLTPPTQPGKAGDAPGSSPLLPVVGANDNRRSAGKLRGNVLTIKLVVQMARWYPQGSNGPFIEVEALSEEGRAPTIPAPLIRVPAGTVVEATLRNALKDSAINIYGLHTRPADLADSVRLLPGETKTIRFGAGAPGTYFYRAVVGKYRDRSPGGPEPDSREREQIAGAFVVDSAGARGDDRIFVINIWGKWKDSTHYQNALAINGKSWPHTERLRATVGDTIRWRVINVSARAHPMHLHGFYFRVDTQGDIRRDTIYSPEQRRLVVTEQIRQGKTFAMTWVPDRPGNWLFHCHIGFHVLPEARLDPPPPRHHANYAHDPGDHMAGLVLGINVDPGGWTPPAETPARQLRLFVHEGPRRGRAPRSLGFVLQRDGRLPAPDSLEPVGSTLFLTQGQPVDVTVVNRLAEPTGVHWHGIELESYSDGVVGWSGMGKRIAPVIAVRDSFTAHLTLPRSGTFIYHTHLNDLEQLTSGLYGAIIVLEPGKDFDPRTDHVYVAGWDGDERPPNVVVNGDSVLPAVAMKLGVSHRLRLINIGVAGGVRFSLWRDTTLVSWRGIAKDGADLPPGQSRNRPANQVLAVGETFDFIFDPPGAGTYALSVEAQPGGVKRRQRIDVR
jgi:FtsP/CotA-like multicopper oxidase with cupredoxin domain